MTIYLCREFIKDLVEHGDAHFASRVLSKIISDEGQFEPDADDHRYNGIEGCWIRYVSRQTTAYRAIFVRRGADIYWYRAGNHSVENRLNAPGALAEAIAIRGAPDGLDALVSHKHPRYLKSLEKRLLKEVLASRVLIPHRNVTLITPRFSAPLFSPVGLIGRLINSVLELGGSVTVITKPPSDRELASYRWLIQRGVDLLIHDRLNVRLLVFEIDEAQLDDELKHVKSIGIVGSSELTEAGIGEGMAGDLKEELCYEINSEDLEGASEFLLKLADGAIGLETHLQRLV